jgi:hypothetical protein
VNAAVAEHVQAQGGLIDQIVPLYAKYFSHKEIKKLRKFYASDLGQKTISVMPALMQESLSLGQEWGAGLAPDIMERVQKRLEEEGISLDEQADMEDAPAPSPSPSPKKKR